MYKNKTTTNNKGQSAVKIKIDNDILNKKQQITYKHNNNML